MRILLFVLIAICIIESATLLVLIFQNKVYDGKLVIDTSNADYDRYSIILDIPFDELPNKKKIVLKPQKNQFI